MISGYLKLYPIEPFEYNFVRLGIANWYTAPVIARGLISIEFILGLLLLFQMPFGKRTLQATIALLIFFTLYLLFQLLTEGNVGNCGCFGTYLEMTPLESIVKNMMMMGIALWLLLTRQYSMQWILQKPKWKEAVLIFVLGVSIPLPYLLNTPEFVIQNQFEKKSIAYTLNLSPLYNEEERRPNVDLRKGKHILSLMSLRCEHCKKAAFKMAIMYKRHPEIPFFNLYKGNPDKYLRSFFEFTHADSIPYMIYNSDHFITLSGGELPAIYWLNDGVVENTSTYLTLNETEILRWLQKP
jgi:hypothetical protein